MKAFESQHTYIPILFKIVTFYRATCFTGLSFCVLFVTQYTGTQRNKSMFGCLFYFHSLFVFLVCSAYLLGEKKKKDSKLRRVFYVLHTPFTHHIIRARAGVAVLWSCDAIFSFHHIRSIRKILLLLLLFFAKICFSKALILLVNFLLRCSLYCCSLFQFGVF